MPSGGSYTYLMVASSSALLRIAHTAQADSFAADLDTLRPKFLGIDAAVADLRELLLLGYALPQLLMSPETLPGV